MMKRAIQLASLLMLMTVLVLATVALAADPAPQDNAEKPLPKLAVKPLEGKGISADTAATLTDVLCTRISTQGKYQVLCASDVQAILAATKQTALLGQCDDDTCYEALGKALNSDYLVVGSIGKVGKSYVISLSLITAADKLTKKRVTHEVKGDESRLIDGIRTAADKLFQ